LLIKYQGRYLYYKLTIISYFILLFGQALWISWLNPDPSIPKSITLVVIVVPLLLPLRGLLNTHSYTFKWVTLFIWLYFILGIWNSFHSTQWPLGLLQVVASLIIFLCAVLYLQKNDTRSHQKFK